jgi:hypothetical protein
VECKKKLTAGSTAVPGALHPLHWTTLGLAPGLCGGQPVANRLVNTSGPSTVDRARTAHCIPITRQLTVVEMAPFQILQNTFLRNKLLIQSNVTQV